MRNSYLNPVNPGCFISNSLSLAYLSYHFYFQVFVARVPFPVVSFSSLVQKPLPSASLRAVRFPLAVSWKPFWFSIFSTSPQVPLPGSKEVQFQLSLVFFFNGSTPFLISVSIPIIYCCKINHLKTQWLKTTFILFTNLSTRLNKANSFQISSFGITWDDWKLGTRII